VRGAANATFQTVVFLFMAAILVRATDPVFARLSVSFELSLITIYLGWAILTLRSSWGC
jgi:hypothetical protein